MDQSILQFKLRSALSVRILEYPEWDQQSVIDTVQLDSEHEPILHPLEAPVTRTYHHK